MHTDKLSEIIAHFVGLFDTAVDEARMRNAYAEGAAPRDAGAAASDEASADPDFASDLALKGYDPGVVYRPATYDLNYEHPRFLHHSFEDTLARLSAIAHRDVTGLHYVPGVDEDGEPELPIFQGPGSVIAHVAQANVLLDDDYLNMTDREPEFRDTTFAIEKTMEFAGKAEAFSPFYTLDRTDSQEGLKAIADDVHDYIQSAKDNGVTSLENTGSDAPQQNFVAAADTITGIYVNGQLTDAAPVLDDMMPDRGIAKPPEDPEKSDVPHQESEGTGHNSLDIAAGANVVANVVSITDASLIASVTAVMGNYHQIDVISQSYVYSDRDEIGSVFNHDDSTATVANNIAVFQHSVYDNGQSADATNSAESHDPTFPTAWRVSVVNGDVTFVNWIEQYHFVSDNDTMTVTSMGSTATVLTGGNVAINLASFLGVGMQYDLVIVGGHMLDMNVISQISVLYDNDWVRAEDGAPNAAVQSGNNLLWNMAEIHNVGAPDRFQAMPDYMSETQKAIEDRDAYMPSGLSHDANFAGYAGLNVLYITGNLYDVNIIKQVSIISDSDDITHVASNVLANNQNASIHIDTGSNAVVNIAQIMDYDSLGHTTYVGGQLYSDAILIQSGLVEHDNSQPQSNAHPLANEVIAFLDDDASHPGSDDVTINGGHDLAWNLAHAVDPMQTAVA